MQVILFRNMDKLGMQGDVVKVAPGFYRNFLGPRGLALEASTANLKRMQMKRKRLQSEAEKQLNEAEAIANRLADVEIRFVMKATDKDKLFGSIHDHEILAKLAAAGFDLDRKQLALREPIKTVGVHNIHVRLLGHVGADIKVYVEAEAGRKPAAEEEPAQPESAAADEAKPEAKSEETTTD